MCKQMVILALDIATKTGWSTGDFHGVWNLKPQKDESGGMRLLRLKEKLKEVIRIAKPGLVVFERVAGRHARSIIVLSEMVGVMKSVMDDADINYRGYSASEIKKHATGKGNCNKEAMIKSCIEKLKITPEDDNEADACWLHHLASKDYTEV